MITLLVVLGLVILTMLLLLRNNKYLMIAALIPSLYLGYYTFTNVVPKYFGYPIQINFTDLTEARVLAAWEDKDLIYVVALNKGEDTPRLISMEATPSNKEMLKQISNKLKSGGAVVVKKNTGNQKGSGQGDNQDDSSLKLVPITEQTIIKKDD